MQRTTISLSILLLATAPAVTLAGTHSHDMNRAEMHASARSHSGQGVVNKVDLQSNKANLTHGPIPSLGWPGMTMGFKVKDTAVLQGIKPGQRVTFEVVNEGPKQYFLTRITPQK